MSRLRKVLSAAAALTLLGCVGCQPLWPVSSAPPLTRGEFNLDSDRVDVTQGVALALACRDVWWNQPCENLTVVSDDPTIATVSLVHLDKYRGRGGQVYDLGRQRSVFLVGGVRPGVTKVRLGGGDVHNVLEVHIHALGAGG